MPKGSKTAAKPKRAPTKTTNRAKSTKKTKGKKTKVTIVAKNPPRRGRKVKSTPPTHEQIAVLAYEIWERWGCPTGRDAEIWHLAERELQA